MTENPATDQNVRMTGIGGSDAPVLMLGEYFGTTPYTLYLEKAGITEPEDISGKENVYWGVTLEDIVAQEFTKRTGMKVRRDQRTKRLWGHHHMMAHIDRRITGKKEGLEVKTASAFSSDQWGDGPEDIPDGYRWQVDHYLAVTGWDTWWLAVLIGGQKFKHYMIRRDESRINALIDKCDEFWRHVLDKSPPPIVHEVDANAAYPYARSGELMCPPEIAGELWSIASNKKAKDEIDRSISEARTIVKKFMGDHEALVTPGGKVLATWRESSSGRRTFLPKYTAIEEDRG